MISHLPRRLIIAASGRHLEIWNIECPPSNGTSLTLTPTHLDPSTSTPWNQVNVTVVHPPPPQLNVLEQLEEGLSRLDHAEAVD